MSTLTPQQVSEWHREQAAVHIQMAESLERSYGIPSIVRYRREQDLGGPANVKGEPPTLEALEKAARDLLPKSGRVSEYARKFMVSTNVIVNLLAKSEKLETGSRGWIKFKEQ